MRKLQLKLKETKEIKPNEDKKEDKKDDDDNDEDDANDGFVFDLLDETDNFLASEIPLLMH